MIIRLALLITLLVIFYYVYRRIRTLPPPERRSGVWWKRQALFSGNLDREEALAILGLSGTPSENDIIAAHRRLIQKLHPDRGGNAYLAARINQAKDTLLK